MTVESRDVPSLLISQLREVKRRSSRLDDDFYILKMPPKCNLSRSEAAFSHQGPLIWNELPFSIRSLTSLSEFKSQLKTHYFNIAFKDVD